MNPRYRPLLWTAGAIALGLVLVVVLRGLGPRDAAPGPRTAPDPQPAALDSAVQRQTPAVVAEDVPPWLQDAPAAVGTGRGAAAPVAAMPSPDLVDPVAAIDGIRTQARRNVRAVDDLMAQLDALEASGQTPPEVELATLRGNLEVARRAQQLALELAESTQQPESPQREQRTAQIIAELQALQGQVRYDVSPGAAAAGRTQ